MNIIVLRVGVHIHFISPLAYSLYQISPSLFHTHTHTRTHTHSLSLSVSVSLSLSPTLPPSLLSPSGKAASAGIIPTSVPESKTVPIAPDGEKGCESCHCSAASRWYQWGPVHEHCRLCNFCYTYWRKYGGLKLPTKWGQL